MEPGAHPPCAACGDDVHAACGYALCRAILEEGIAEGRAAYARCGGECTVSDPGPLSLIGAQRSTQVHCSDEFAVCSSACQGKCLGGVRFHLLAAPVPSRPPSVERPDLFGDGRRRNYPLDAGVLAFVVAKSAK
ncbi:hypothetical protein ZWY2020_033910 [Hordeum vulgare]|nr:hypothetical protein ZWY2020_033910 [Hordeum vulgare]